MDGAKKTLLMVSLLIIALSTLALPDIRAGGNLEAIVRGGRFISNIRWHPEIFGNVQNPGLSPGHTPITWFLSDSHQDGVAFTNDEISASNEDQAKLLQALEAAFDPWTRVATASVDVTFGGPTRIRDVGIDGQFIVTFEDAFVLSGQASFLAQAPVTVLTESIVVSDEANGDPSDGFGTIAVQGEDSFGNSVTVTIAVPVPLGGSLLYPAGTIVDADIRVNSRLSSALTLETECGGRETPGRFSLTDVLTHEVGHTLGLSHTPLLCATMYPAIDSLPVSLLTDTDGEGQSSLEVDDVAALSRLYPTASFLAETGTLAGTVFHPGTQNGRADGVHVIALEATTLAPVLSRFSLSRFMDPQDPIDGDDFQTHGAGFFRLDGLPPGEYFIYVEYLDNTAPVNARLNGRYNRTITNSNVARGRSINGITPLLTEFYNVNDMSFTGDGREAGLLDAEHPDRATRVSVVSGMVVSGMDISLPLTAENGVDPTGLQAVDNDNPLASINTFVNLGSDDDNYLLIRFPASRLPAPPYNIRSGMWIRGGLADRPYRSSLWTIPPGSPLPTAPRPVASPGLSEGLRHPIVAVAGRVVTGRAGGFTEGQDLQEVTDRWNVTINEPSDIIIAIQQPGSTSLRNLVLGAYVLQNSQGNKNLGDSIAFLTTDGGETFAAGGGARDGRSAPPYLLLLETAPPLLISGASPDVLKADDPQQTIIIHGVGFQPGAQVGLGDGVIIHSVTFIDATRLEVQVSVGSGASAGSVVVSVRNPEVLFPTQAKVMRLQE